MAWLQLLMMAEENAINWSATDKSIPYLCPLCGFPLRSNPRTQTRDCPVGDFSWPSMMSVPWRDNAV